MITFGSVSVDLSEILNAAATLVGAVAALVAAIYSRRRQASTSSTDNDQEDAT